MTNIFIRHGEVENPKDIYYVDIPGYKLSKKGQDQAVQTGNFLKTKDYRFDIVTSPILRARQTGEIISNIISTNITTSEHLYEHMGPQNWKGLRFDEIDQDSTGDVGETYLSAYERVKKLDDKCDKKIFISHQDTIRAFTYFVVEGSDKDVQTDNFNNLKPSHCEVQTIDDVNKSVLQLFKPS